MDGFGGFDVLGPARAAPARRNPNSFKILGKTVEIYENGWIWRF